MALLRRSSVHSATDGFAIAPHDTNELPQTTRGIYVGGAGDLTVILVQDAVAMTFVAVPAGTLLPIQARIVKSTGTTATALLGLA